MPIIELQRRLAPAGRIRIGQQVESRSGKKHPAALETFRLTSPDRARIAEAAKLYGGAVTTWQSPSGRDDFEVITKADRLPVLVPPSALAFSQWMEQWVSGGCKRRCDTVTEQISDQPCLCNPESPACEPTTRLSLLLSEIRGMGLWRLDTTGWYAARELQGAVDILSLAAGKGGSMLPATLRLDRREIKRPDEPLKRFAVPVLDIDITPAQLMLGVVSVEPAAAPRPALTAVPDGGPPASIADQVKSAEDIPSRRRASTATLASTGIAPRTAAQVNAARAQAEDGPRMITKGQLTKLAVSLRERGFDDDSPQGREARLDWCAKVINRSIGSAKELTYAEGKTVLDFLASPSNPAGRDSEPAEAAVVVDEVVEPEDTGEQIGLHLVAPGDGTCTAVPPTSEQCDAIVKLYEAKGVTGPAVLDDINEFLQSEQRVASLHTLTREEADAVIQQLQVAPDG